MSSEKGRMFSQLKWKDRIRIEKMLKEKKSKTEIARTLRVDYTTIMREIKRGMTVQRDTNLVDRMVYCAGTAGGNIRRTCGRRGRTSNWETTMSWQTTSKGKLRMMDTPRKRPCIKSKRTGLRSPSPYPSGP